MTKRLIVKILKNTKLNYKLFNDPIYGFISVDKYFLKFIDHPYFQRLRRINQMGMSNLVFPGANHKRFQHALGCFHLMDTTIITLRNKGILISEEEELNVKLSILLHDIGHSPFSHSLEKVITPFTHEDISLEVMKYFNETMDLDLSPMIRMFKDQYPRKFLNSLVSSQLDIDRLDYLKRDSFFAGVAEGNINSDRIISVFDVHNDELVIEEKGIFSIEKFLIARRTMFWQVYLHKTGLAVDKLLKSIFKRVKFLLNEGENIFIHPFLKYLISIENTDGVNLNEKFIEYFMSIDDNDIFFHIKEWQNSNDRIISLLCKMFVNRNLFKVRTSNNAFEEELLNKLKIDVSKKFNISIKDSDYFVFEDQMKSITYDTDSKPITLKLKTVEGKYKPLIDLPQFKYFNLLSENEMKYFVCFPDN